MKNVISTVPRTLSRGENTISNPCEIANVFNNYFASTIFSEYLKHQCNNSTLFYPTYRL